MSEPDLTVPKNLTLRPASPDDAKMLFEWRNDALTCRMSVNSEPVEWNGHVQWLERRLSRENPDLYVAIEADTPVGTVRIDGDEISYTVAPAHRGRGVAIRMLALARQLFGVKQAHIKPENHASINAARKAGHKVVLLSN